MGGIPNFIPGALNVGIAMAHARHALGRHLQQQQQQRHQEGTTSTPPGGEDLEEDEDEDIEEEEEEEDEDIADEEVLPKPSYLTNDHLLAMECAKTGKAPEQLESEYKDEVLARKWQIKEARMEETRQRRMVERRQAHQQQQQQQQQQL